jgi:hypothetical protein
MKTLIIEPQYLPNLRFISKFLLFDQIIFDDTSNFIKQTYRNRTYILAANGPLPLVVPVKKGRSKTPYGKLQIDSKVKWQKKHWNTIISAYHKSPYFLHYQDIFLQFFENDYDLLFDFNIAIIKEILNILKIEKEFSPLSVSDDLNMADVTDLRNHIHPKLARNQPDEHYKPVEYWQVFGDRYEFVPELSILDVLFNEGPEARELLENSIR